MCRSMLLQTRTPLTPNSGGSHKACAGGAPHPQGAWPTSAPAPARTACRQARLLIVSGGRVARDVRSYRVTLLLIKAKVRRGGPLPTRMADATSPPSVVPCPQVGPGHSRATPRVAPLPMLSSGVLRGGTFLPALAPDCLLLLRTVRCAALGQLLVARLN